MGRALRNIKQALPPYSRFTLLAVIFAIVYVLVTASIGAIILRTQMSVNAVGVIPCEVDEEACLSDSTPPILSVNKTSDTPVEKVFEITVQDLESGFEDILIEFNNSGTWINLQNAYPNDPELSFTEGGDGYDETTIIFTLKDDYYYSLFGADNITDPFTIKFSSKNTQGIETLSEQRVEFTNVAFSNPYANTTFGYDLADMSDFIDELDSVHIGLNKTMGENCSYPKQVLWEVETDTDPITGTYDTGYDFLGGDCDIDFSVDLSSGSFTPGQDYTVRARIIDFYGDAYPSDTTWYETTLTRITGASISISFNNTTGILTVTATRASSSNFDRFISLIWELEDSENNPILTGSEGLDETCCTVQIDLSEENLPAGNYIFKSRLQVEPEEYFPSDSTWYSQSFTVEGESTPVLPVISFTDAPTNGGKYRSEAVYFAGSVSHPTNNIIALTVAWSGAFEGSQEVELVDGSLDSNNEAFAQPLNFTGQPDGEITVVFTAEDSQNQVVTATRTFNVIDDNNAPSTTVNTISPDPTDNPRPTFSGNASDTQTNITKIEYRILSYSHGVIVDWTEINSEDGAIDSQEESYNVTPTVDLPDGNIEVVVRATDEVGNVTQDGNEGRDLIVINALDQTAPDIVLQPIVPNPTVDPEPKLLASITDDPDDKTSNISQVYYRINGGAWEEATAVDGEFNELTETINVTMTGLGLGAHTAEVRAVDADGNDTNNQDKNKEIEFEIITQDPNIPASKLEKDEQFNDHDDHDTALSNAIWGNGQLRLKSTVSLNRTTIDSSNLSPRYEPYGGENKIISSRFGGFWADRRINYFLYVNASGGVTTYNLNTIFGGTHVIRDIREVYNGSRTHLWVMSGERIFVIDINNTPANTGDDQTLDLTDHPDYLNRSGYFMMVPDTRNPANYGMFIYDDYNYVVNDPAVRLTYVRLQGSFTNAADDSVYTFSGDNAIRYGGITNLKFGPDGRLWITKDGNGDLVSWDDNDTPTNEGDDTVVDRGISTTFDVTWDDHGRTIVCGSGTGIRVILSENGTPNNPEDDTVFQLLTPQEMQGFACSNIHYIQGAYPVGGQILFNVHSNGYLFHLFTNDSYQDKIDDQLLRHDLTGGNYPADKPGILFSGDNRFYANIARYGTFRFDMTRGFEEQNVAVSKTDAQIEGRLLADFVSIKRLVMLSNGASGNSTGIAALPQGVTIEVSNDGGLTWYGIDDGEIVDFPTDDYRVRYRLVLNRLPDGSTPVVDRLTLSYSAYLNQDAINFTTYVPSFVNTTGVVGKPFSVSIEAQDQLGNIFADNSIVTLALRRVGEGTNLSGLNITTAQVVNGRITLNNLTFPQAGTYQIYVTNGTIAGLSNNTITLATEPDDAVAPVPSIVFTADKYRIKKGQEVELKWSSTNIKTAEILGIGAVAVNGSKKLKPAVTTTYQIRGDGDYGPVSASLKIFVDEDGSGLLKDLQAEVDRNDIILGEKFTLTWISDNADYISISGREGKFAPNGSLDIFPNSAGTYKVTVTAHFSDGTSISKDLSVKVAAKKSTAGDLRKEIRITDTIFGRGSMVAATAVVALALFQFPVIEFLRSINHIGVIFGVLIARKRKYWGIVFDSVANEPVPFAVVRIYENGKFISETVSDLKGRYAILLDHDGVYDLDVSASEFKAFKKKISIDDNNEVVEDVPLERLNQKLSLWKKVRYSLRNGDYRELRLALTVLMILGFVYTIYATLTNPVFLNVVLTTVYVLIFALNVFMVTRLWERYAGKVMEKGNNRAVGGAIVRVYDNSKQVEVALANSKGLVKLNLAPKNYQFTVNKEGFAHIVETPSPKMAYLEEIYVSNSGYLKKNLFLKKRKGRINKGGLTTPFGS